MAAVQLQAPASVQEVPPRGLFSSLTMQEAHSEAAARFCSQEEGGDQGPGTPPSVPLAPGSPPQP